MMPTLKGSMPYDSGPERPCIWCGQPTDITFVPEFQPELGPLPMHMLCGVLLIRAYERWQRGRTLDAGTTARLLAIHK